MSLDKKQSILVKRGLEKYPDLIEKLRIGDRKSQFEVYKKYYKAMYNTAYRIVNNSGEAEDLMQDSFLDAFEKIGQYNGGATFGAWLKKIVINNSINLQRKKMPLVPIENEEIEVGHNQEESHLDILSYKIDEIRQAIENLPENYRIIISLYLLEGYDHEEISQILDISYDNSRTRYSRARQRLLHDLKERKKTPVS